MLMRQLAPSHSPQPHPQPRPEQTKRICSSICVLANTSAGRCGVDFFTAGAPDPPGPDNRYSTWIYRDEATAAIRALRPGSPPLFLYIGWQAAHVPLQPPPDPDYAIRRCSHVGDPRRLVYCAMITALDDAIGNITAALASARLLDQTLIVAFSDNGGMPSFSGPSGVLCDSVGSNFPARGGKATLFEGGVNVVAMLGGGWIPASARGSQYKGLVHAVDLAPTLLRAVGLDPNVATTAPAMDGVQQWDAMVAGVHSPADGPRTMVPINVEGNGSSNTAIRVGDLKMIVKPDIRYDGWYPPLPAAHIPANTSCGAVCLFNLTADPTERNDLASELPEAVKILKGQLEAIVTGPGGYNNGQSFRGHPEAWPVFHRGFWAPFVKAQTEI